MRLIPLLITLTALSSIFVGGIIQLGGGIIPNEYCRGGIKYHLDDYGHHRPMIKDNEPISCTD